MGMWIELGIFVLVMLFGWQQIREVRREQAKRRKRGDRPAED